MCLSHTTGQNVRVVFSQTSYSVVSSHLLHQVHWSSNYCKPFHVWFIYFVYRLWRIESSLWNIWMKRQVSPQSLNGQSNIFILMINILVLKYCSLMRKIAVILISDTWVYIYFVCYIFLLLAIEYLRNQKLMC